jgi:hypothetical protein
MKTCNAVHQNLQVTVTAVCEGRVGVGVGVIGDRAVSTCDIVAVIRVCAVRHNVLSAERVHVKRECRAS